MASLLKKVILDPSSFSIVSLVLAGMMLVVKTCMTYFPREELNYPPPTNPSIMVLIIILEPHFCILQGKVTKMTSN